MTHFIPRYIEESRIQDVRIQFHWDDWDLEKSYEPIDEDLQNRIQQLSYRAVLALTIAQTEWVVHRFDLLLDEPMAHHYCEAAWAAIVDWRYCRYYEPPDNEWRGPVKGPVSLAVMFVVNAIVRVLEDDNPAIEAANTASLAKHVLVSAEPFHHWQERVFQRLETLYPYRNEDPMGDLVPREVLDPDFGFRPQEARDFIQTWLGKLNFRINPFLRSPEEMIGIGFRGTPYVVDIENDRITRTQ